MQFSRLLHQQPEEISPRTLRYMPLNFLVTCCQRGRSVYRSLGFKWESVWFFIAFSKTIVFWLLVILVCWCFDHTLNGCYYYFLSLCYLWDDHSPLLDCVVLCCSLSLLSHTTKLYVTWKKCPMYLIDCAFAFKRKFKIMHKFRGSSCLSHTSQSDDYIHWLYHMLKLWSICCHQLPKGGRLKAHFLPWWFW